jgi:hypothetical protein
MLSVNKKLHFRSDLSNPQNLWHISRAPLERPRELTYKSISDLLQQLERDGKVARFVPRTRAGTGRRLYLSAAAERNRSDAHSAVNMLSGEGFIRAALTRWASGGLVHATDRGKPRFLKELDPPPRDFWEIRVYEPNVQSRLIGSFLEQDTLVLVKLTTRSLLGKRGSTQWNSALRECEESWRNIFGSTPRMHANDIGDYVSANYDHFNLKR